MGFYALWKWFSPWSKRDYPNMIYWYKEYVLKTPEQREQERIENKRKARTALAQLAIMNTMCSNLGGDYY
jgi:hypothetical protein